ncbi:MAG: hypothetical protein JNL57_07670 [Bacteroidetes bacterium]|nr:hypothetical protein [Bacteroidota bacterium]
MEYSWGKGIKDYLIHWPNGKVDSLFVDFKRDDSRNNWCCCQFPLQKMTLNGKSYTRKTEDYKYGTFLFDMK